MNEGHEGGKGRAPNKGRELGIELTGEVIEGSVESSLFELLFNIIKLIVHNSRSSLVIWILHRVLHAFCSKEGHFQTKGGHTKFFQVSHVFCIY